MKAASTVTESVMHRGAIVLYSTCSFSLYVPYVFQREGDEQCAAKRMAEKVYKSCVLQIGNFRGKLNRPFETMPVPTIA